MCRLSNMLSNNQWITEEIKEEIKKYLETNENESIMMQNLWDTVKSVLRGKFRAIQFYLRKKEKSQINNLKLHLKQLKRNEQNPPKLVKKSLGIRAEIKIDTRK